MVHLVYNDCNIVFTYLHTTQTRLKTFCLPILIWQRVISNRFLVQFVVNDIKNYSFRFVNNLTEVCEKNCQRETEKENPIRRVQAKGGSKNFN